MNLKISTVTPIHIGNGERYTRAEFIVRGDKIIRIDTNKIFTHLREKDQERFIDELEDPYKLFRCHSIMNCVEVCPKGLSPTRAIGRIKELMVKRSV